MNKEEEKQESNAVNYNKNNLCPKALCSNHTMIYCKVHNKYYCSLHICDNCLSSLKPPPFERNKGTGPI